MLIGKWAAEFGTFASFVTPAFFQVVPASKLWRTGRMLRARSQDRKVREQVTVERQRDLERSGLPIVLRDAASKEETSATAERSQPKRGGSCEARELRASRVCTLYFHQLFSDTPTLLDLREGAFSERGGQLQWQPGPWTVKWDTTFVRAIREVYQGFYTDSHASFGRGLRRLGLEPVEDVFRQHFGAPENTRFEVSHFVASFHAVFVRCKETGAKLHPDFLPLGLQLAMLYDHLQTLDVAVNVTECFQRAAMLPKLAQVEAERA